MRNVAGMNKKRWATVIGLLVLIGGIKMLWMLPRTKTWKIPQGEKPVSNPLKGWVCWGENLEEGKGVFLAYVPIYWNALEPQKGRYDFKALEDQFHFAQWKEKGTRLILRVVADSPSQEGKMQIPQWLYDEIQGDGTWYENEYGRGFSPNYENAVFQKAHTRLLQALGERYNADAQIAYIQLGSLGHWGEWHVNQASGIRKFPDTTVTDQYVEDYVKAFPDKKLLMRRPYGVVSLYQMGLYNDSFGEEEPHRQWISWIRDGYVSDQNGQELSGAPGFWEEAPSGGEIASYHEIAWYFSPEQYQKTLSFIRESHTTFLGPHIPHEKEMEPVEWENAIRCQQEMGYCFTIEKASLVHRRGKDYELRLNWKNIGIAPFYGDWKVRVALRDDSGAVQFCQDCEAQTSSWGEEVTTLSCRLQDTAKLPEGSYTVWVGLVDPMTDACSIALAVDLPCQDGMYCIGSF